VKEADVAAAGIVSDAGTENAGFVLESRISAPPAGAAAERFTVQISLLAAATHASELIAIVGLRLTVPPFAVMETELPPGAAAMAPLTPTLIAAELEAVADTIAITPFAIAVAFVPLAIQVYPPDVTTHVTVLLAAVNAAPAATERLDALAG